MSPWLAGHFPAINVLLPTSKVFSVHTITGGAVVESTETRDRQSWLFLTH